MTDKQIIDGVDVSGCPHLIEDYQWWNIAGQEEHSTNVCALSFDDYRDFEEDDFCKDNPNCYYKQLKRKEQECERLKEENVEIRKYQYEQDFLQEQLEAYKMEAEEGKEINAELKAENEELKFQNKRLDEVASYWHKRIFKVERSERKLKQALQEIKELLLKTPTDSPEHCANAKSVILQKISEVDDE